ncbi:MAG: ribonuclease R [Clostridia bacterium]
MKKNNKDFKKSKQTRPKSKKNKKSSFLNPIENKILDFLKRRKDEVFSSRELMKKSGIKDKESFYNALHKLCEYDLVNVDKKHKVSFNSPNQTTGTVVSLSKGFAFISVDNQDEDVFVPGRFMKKAFIGDKVVLGDIETDAKGKIGKILEITESGKEFTTGTVIKEEFGLALVPDGAIRYNPIILNPEKVNIGDKVYAKIVQDHYGDWTRAEIVRVFGSSQSARVCSDAVIEQYDIQTVFSNEAVKEAKTICTAPITKEEFNGRLDLRDDPIFTIDSADSKDLDDAISIKKHEDFWELGVHIADVSHYIKPHSDLDKEAFMRGTSVYFADRVIPMLPKEISNGTCSLNPNEDRLCLSAIIKLDLQGNIKKYKFHKSVIHSKVKGVYSEINEIFAGTASDEILEKYKTVQNSLNLSLELAKILEQNAKGRGTMDIESDESKFVLDANGVCVDIKPRTSGQSQELIEQFMVTANICASRFAKDNNLPFIYRVHQSPEPQRIRALAEILQALGINTKDILKEKPNTGDFQKILASSKGTPAHSLVSQRILRTMEKAKYSSEPLGHFGLNLKDYSHFTSPIRRYPDLSIHRIISFVLEGESGDVKKRFENFVQNSSNQSSDCELKATRASRDADDCYMAEYMGAHIGEHFTGEISGVTKNGIFVKLESSVEGFLPISEFKHNNFIFDGTINHRCSNTGKVLTIGEKLNIIVASSHVATGKVDFSLDE